MRTKVNVVKTIVKEVMGKENNNQHGKEYPLNFYGSYYSQLPWNETDYPFYNLRPIFSSKLEFFRERFPDEIKKNEYFDSLMSFVFTGGLLDAVTQLSISNGSVTNKVEFGIYNKELRDGINSHIKVALELSKN